MRLLLLPLLLAVLAGCAKPTAVTPPWTSPPSGAFLAADGSTLSDGAVADLARSAGFTLVGESHTNLCDHAVQARLIETLAGNGFRFVIGLEMLPVTAQPVLDRFNARELGPRELEEAVGWKELWGYPYAQYRPIFELAKRYDLPVAALNIPRRVLTTFRDKGEEGLTDEDRSAMPARIIPVSPAQKASLEEQVGLHQSMRAAAKDSKNGRDDAPDMDAMTERFFLVQSLWDSMMAEQALAWREKLDMPVLILTGSGHVEHGWGIEYRLRTLDPGASTLAVMPVRDGEDFALQADASLRPLPGGETVFFHCAAQHRSRLGMNILFEEDGMRVESVEPGSRAEQAGLRAGDVLVSAGERPLKEATDLHFAAMAAARSDEPLRLTVRRGAETLNLDLPLH
jgi:uncharacterized iron-regulated protein